MVKINAFFHKILIYLESYDKLGFTARHFMKTGIHPQYFQNAKVVCACGNEFTTGSTVEELHVEICSNCHPFFTGNQKLVDTAGRVERFQKRVRVTETISKTRRTKKVKRAARAKKKSETEK